MPEAILERILLVSSNEGEKVFDPFLGSGTTVVAAKKMNRQFMGFELSPEYWEQCQKRLEKTEQRLL
jgi:DNA modification methylase